MSLDERARALYDAMVVPKPNWDQLGVVTKSVWRERAAQQEKDVTPIDRDSDLG